MIRLTTVFAQVKDKLRSRPTRLSNIFEGSTARACGCVDEQEHEVFRLTMNRSIVTVPFFIG